VTCKTRMDGMDLYYFAPILQNNPPEHAILCQFPQKMQEMVSRQGWRMWIRWVFEPCNQLKAKIVYGNSDTGAAIICNQIFREVDSPGINQCYKVILILHEWNGFIRHSNNIFPYHLNPRSGDKQILSWVFFLDFP